MGIAKKYMIERQNEEFEECEAEHLASHLEISREELDELNYTIDPNYSNDGGILYDYYIEFYEDERSRGVEESQKTP